MRNRIAELFLWLALGAFYTSKLISPQLTMDYMAYMVLEFVKDHISEFEFEINGKTQTVIPTEIVMTKKDGRG